MATQQIHGEYQIELATIKDAQIAAAAGIAYSKLSLTGSIVNADISGAAAIDWTKVSKVGSSLADLATRSASDLSSGTLPAARMPALTGDVTSSSGSVATTLATVNSNVGTFGSSTKASVVTVNAKGLVTAASEVTITPAASSITGTLGPTHGGTGLSSYTTGDLLYASASNVLSALAATTDGYVLTLASGLPVWSAAAAGTVTAVSVASANGFAGTSSGGSTPALTLTTTVTGVLKGNGTAISAATAGTDYSAGTSGLATGILKSTTTTGVLSIAVAGDFPTLNQNTTGSAAKWTTPRNLAGNSVDGSADVAFANKFIVQGTSDAGLSAAQFLGSLSTGIVKNTTTTGVLSIAAAATDYVAPSAYASANGLTMATSRLLGRTTGSTGAAEEISVAGSLTLAGGVLTGTAGGTVTSVSVASANGFAGSSSGGATPALTLSTTITGVLKGNGTAISAATAGTDYSDGTAGLATGILKSTTTTGALSIAVAGDFPTLNQNTTGSAATLTTPRNIGGVSFNGSADITVATATGGFTVSGGNLALGTNSLTLTGSIGATGARVTKGWFTDLEVTNAIVGAITGNAATATALATARNINGVAFDGTANITVTAAAGTLTGTTLNSSVVTSSLTSTGTLTGGATGAGFTIALSTSTVTGTLGLVRGGLGFDASGIAKGGLLAGTGAGAMGILTSSTNGLVLTLDSSHATGLAWTAAGSGTVTGSGTTGKLAQWSGAGSLTDGPTASDVALLSGTTAFTVTQSITKSAGGELLKLTASTGANALWQTFNNTGGVTYLGRESSAGGSIFTGSSTYASVFGTGSAHNVELATDNTVRFVVGTSFVQSQVELSVALAFSNTAGTAAFKMLNAAQNRAWAQRINTSDTFALDYYNGSAWTNYLTLTTAGVMAASSLASGSLAISGGSNIVLDVQRAGSSAQFFNYQLSSSGTNYIYGLMQNTGGQLGMGVDTSTGGGAISGGTAYGVFTGAWNNVAYHLIQNSAAKLSINGSYMQALVEFGVALAFSNTAGTAAFKLSNVAGTRLWAQRIDTSDGFNFDYYNGSAWVNKLSVGAAGDMRYGGGMVDSVGTPSISSGGGTGATIAGTDYAFKIVVGTTPGSTPIVVNFGHTFSSAPIVVTSSDLGDFTGPGGSILANVRSVSTSGVTLAVGGSSNWVAGATIYVHVRGY